jgi:hypothetical protein
VVWRICLVLGVVGLLLPAGGQPFYTNSPLATAYNQGRHLVLDPTTGWLHLVYAYGESGDDPIYYTYSTDHGDNWQPSECVGYGTNPCVVCEGGAAWVSYLQYDRILTALRLAPGQWQTYTTCPGGASTPPSMAVRHDPLGPGGGPAVYVVYGVITINPPFWWIYMSTVSVSLGVFPVEPVMLSIFDDPLLEPSVAVTPGDLLNPGELVHVAWREDFPTDTVVWYSLGLPPVPPEWPPIHHWQAPEEVTWEQGPANKPAFCPSVEAFGDSVYAVWRAKAQGSEEGTIYRAARPLLWPQWVQSGPLGFAAYSNNPQQSTPWACAWHERNAYPTEDIWANLFTQLPPIPIQEDGPRSMYPNIVAEWPEVNEQPLVFYTVWTSETPGPPYGVLFRRDAFWPQQDGFKGYVYYDCQVGDSIKSRYCLARDGCARWREYSVDYGRKSLTYRLPYLNPNYDYKVMVVLFQAGRDTWEQSFTFDSVQVGKARFLPLVPETVLLYIPRDKYAKDCRVDFDIMKVAGEYAVIAELKLFECFPYRRKLGGEGEDGGLVNKSGSAVELFQPVPSLFKQATNVSYAVSEPRRVAVSVYDVQGRMVRRLASGFCARGKYATSWNGLDEAGREVPAGAYLLRIESGGFSQTRRVGLTR